MPDDVENAKRFDEKYRMYKINKRIYDDNVNLYNRNMNNLMKFFHDDIKKEFNVENNPKEEMLFTLSIEHHEYNYFKIYEHYKKHVELIK